MRSYRTAIPLWQAFLPGAANAYPFTRAAEGETPILLGIAATHLFEWDGKDLIVYTAGKTDWSGGTTVGQAVLGLTNGPLATIFGEASAEIQKGKILALKLAPRSAVVLKGK